MSFTFQVDWPGLQAKYGASVKASLGIAFPCCTQGIALGDWVTPGQTSKSLTVAAISAAMAQSNVDLKMPVQWFLVVHAPPGERTTSTFFMKPPHAVGPKVTISLSPDGPSSWPATFTVKNEGDQKADASVLAVKVAVENSENARVREVCVPVFREFRANIPALSPGSKSDVHTDHYVDHRFPGKLATPTPGTPFKSPLAAPTHAPAPGTVPCRFDLSASLAAAPGSALANVSGVWGSLVRTLTIDVKPR